MPQKKSFTPAIDQLMRDAGAITASAAALVGGVAKEFNLGPGLYEGRIHVELTAFDITGGAGGFERYNILVQGKDAAGNWTTLAQLQIGEATVTDHGEDSVAGHYVIYFANEHNGEIFETIRLFDAMSGETPSINYSAWLD